LAENGKQWRPVILAAQIAKATNRAIGNRKAMTDKQQRFVAEYLKDLNATQAAIRAGYSPKAANREGARLLSKVDISAAIVAGKRRQLQGGGGSR
jgi:hypothetical protein